MKKRLLAAALALTMSFSLVPAPAFAADIPAATTAPTGTPAPTRAPATPVTPEPTQAPAVTLTPAPTEAPATTVTPEPTRAPALTTTPAPSATPADQGTAQPGTTVLDKATLNKALALLNATPTPSATPAAGETDQTTGDKATARATASPVPTKAPAAAQPALLRTPMAAPVNEAVPQPTAKFAFDNMEAQVTLTAEQNADLTVQVPKDPKDPEGEKVTETIAQWRPDAANNSGTLTVTKYLSYTSLDTSIITLPELASITINHDKDQCGDIPDGNLRRIQISLTGSPTLTLQGGTEKSPLALYAIACSCSTVTVERGSVYLYSMTFSSGNAAERPTLFIAEDASLDLGSLDSNAILDVRGSLTMNGDHYSSASPSIRFNTLTQHENSSVSVYSASRITVAQAGDSLPTLSPGTLGLDPKKPQACSSWTFEYANKPSQTPSLFAPYEEYLHLGDGKYIGVRAKIEEGSVYKVTLVPYLDDSDSDFVVSYFQNPGFKAEDHIYQKGTDSSLTFSHPLTPNETNYRAADLYKRTTRAKNPRDDIYTLVDGYQNIKKLVGISMDDSTVTYALPAEQLEALDCGTYAVPCYVGNNFSNIIMLRFQVADHRITVHDNGTLTFDPASLGEGAASYDADSKILTINGSDDPAKPLQVSRIDGPEDLTIRVNGAVEMPSLTKETYKLVLGEKDKAPASFRCGGDISVLNLTVSHHSSLSAKNITVKNSLSVEEESTLSATGKLTAENLFIANPNMLEEPSTVSAGEIDVTDRIHVAYKSGLTATNNGKITAGRMDFDPWSTITAGNLTCKGKLSSHSTHDFAAPADFINLNVNSVTCTGLETTRTFHCSGDITVNGHFDVDGGEKAIVQMNSLTIGSPECSGDKFTLNVRSRGRFTVTGDVKIYSKINLDNPCFTAPGQATITVGSITANKPIRCSGSTRLTVKGDVAAPQVFCTENAQMNVKGNVVASSVEANVVSKVFCTHNAQMNVEGNVNAGLIAVGAGTQGSTALTASNITATGNLVVDPGDTVTAKTDITAKNILSPANTAANKGGTVKAGRNITANGNLTVEPNYTVTAGRSIIAETGSITAKEGSSVKATTGSITAKAVTAEKGTELTAGDSLNITGTTGDTPLLQLDKTTKLATGKITVPKDVNEDQIEAPGLSLALPGGDVDDTGILYPSKGSKPTYKNGQWTEVPPVITDLKPTTFDKVWYTAETTAKINYHIGDVLFGWFIAQIPDSNPAEFYGSVTLTRPLSPDEPEIVALPDPQPGADPTKTITLTKDTQYTVREGSLIVELIPTALPDDFKKAGGYTLTVNYKDGSKTFPLTIVEGTRPKPVTPAGSDTTPADPLAAGTGYQTGDKANYALPIGLAMLCFAGMAGCTAFLVKPRRKEGEEE